MMTGSNLGNQMRELAATGHPRAAELVEAADAYEKELRASPKEYSHDRFLSTSVIAQKLWRECSGELLA